MKEKILYIFDYNLEESFKITLSIHLKSHGFILVPVPRLNMDYFSEKGQKTIICVCNSMRSIREIRDLKKRYFKYALLNKKISLIEFSFNFRKDSIWGQMRNYHCYSLPVDYMKMSEQISKSYHEFLKLNSKWPGGRRSKLSMKNLT